MALTPYLSEHPGVNVDDAVNKARWAFPLWSITGLTGGGAGNLDGVDVTGIVTGTTVKVVIAGVLSHYQLQETTDQESSPDLIIPDSDPESTQRGWVIIPTPGAGTVTSVALSMPSDFGVAGSPVTGAGGFAVTENAQAANKIKAGPTTGADAAPTYRSLVLADLPVAVVGGLNYQGTWNSSTNSPALADGVGTKGFYYKVSVAGTTSIDGIAEWNVGDLIVFNGTIWDKIDNTEEDATTALKGRVKLAGDLAGTAALPVVTQASTSFALPGVITPTQLSADTDDWAPTGLSAASIIRVSTDASRNLTGLTGGASGRVIALANVGSFNLVLKKLSSSSSAGNQFSLTQDLIVIPTQIVLLVYDNTSTKWRCLEDAKNGTAVVTSTLVTDGDSLSVATYQAGLSTTETFTATQAAVSGRTLLMMQDASFHTVDTLFTRCGRRNVVVIWGGTNDFAVDLASVETVFNRLLAYCNYRRKAGWSVIVCTMISRTGTGIGAATLDSLKNTFNALIRLHWPTFADGLADLASNTHLGTDGSYSNTTYYNVDAIHLNATGYALVAGIVSSAINNFTAGYRWLPSYALLANAQSLNALTFAGVVKTILGLDASDRLQIGVTGIDNSMAGGLQVLGSMVSPGGTGGFELEYNGGISYITSYNRGGAAWVPITIRGSTILLQNSGSTALSLTAGVANIPNLTASRWVKTDASKNLVSYDLDTDLALKAPLASPSFTGTVNMAGLTASQIVRTDGSKNLVSALNYVASVATKTPSATPVWDFDAAEEETMSLTAAVTSMTTSNRGDGKKKTIWIVSDGTLRNLAVNASWIPIGAAIDASLAANKVGVLALHCKGSTEALVYYSYKAQP